MSLIEPRTLKGFRDYPPELMIPRERLIDVARRVYRSYGFAPIDTPALEYAEVLLGKGGEESDRIVYRFIDHGKRDVALPILRARDKLPKQGREAVMRELTAASADGVGLAAEQAARVLALVETRGGNAEILDRTEREFGTSPLVAEGVAKLRELLAVA